MFYDNLETLLLKSQKYFDILFYKNVLYIGLKHYSEKDNCWKEIKKIFKPNKNFLITEINEKNLLYENQEIKDWCKNKFIELECQELEDKEQEKIKSFYQVLIDVDKELSKIAEGREVDGG